VPIRTSQRELSEDERARLRGFRELPSWPRWWLGAIVLCFFGAGCISNVLNRVILGDAWKSADSRYVTLVIFVGGLLATFVSAHARRRERRKFAARRASIAEQGAVVVYEVSFARAWKITGPIEDDDPDPDPGPHALLEVLPNLMIVLPAPEDEDAHEAYASRVGDRAMPNAIVSGTMPRDRVLIERAATVSRPDESILLSVRWVGAPMQYAGAVKAEDLSWPMIRDLQQFTVHVTKIARGPWMDDDARRDAASDGRTTNT